MLEGNRRVVEVPVLGITRQYLGVSAYMRQDSLNALLREGDVVSGAYLGVESGAEADVYARLHARPRVLGMVANASAIRSFYATIGEFVLFYNLVATLLAGIDRARRRLQQRADRPVGAGTRAREPARPGFHPRRDRLHPAR